MKPSKKSVVVILLIVTAVFMGVFQYEKQAEPQGSIQAGASTGYDRGSRNTGSRERAATKAATGEKPGSRPYASDSEQVTGGSRPTEYEGNELSNADAQYVTQNSDTASNYYSSGLGAGCVTDTTVRPGYRYYNADELATGLLYDLVPLAPYFVEAQETYGIDAVFLAAVAAEESGWGRYQFRQNNIFGFENCDFESVEQCIDYAASWLKTQYLTPGGPYYEGVGVADINQCYNGRPVWEEHVTTIMHQIVDRIESEVN